MECSCSWIGRGGCAGVAVAVHFSTCCMHAPRCPHQVYQYALGAVRSNVNTICEIGYGAGHSTVLWLTLAPHATLHTFDPLVGAGWCVGGVGGWSRGWLGGVGGWAGGGWSSGGCGL